MFLKNDNTISELFAKGKKRLLKSPYRVLIIENDGESGYVVAVSKKLFKRAVDRNRIKRLMRVGIQNNDPGKSIAIVFVDDRMPDKKLIQQISENL